VIEDLGVMTEQLDERHREALEWFDRHRGLRVPWAEIKAHADEGARLVNQAKGIYKPKYTDYALSVRTLQEGPYPDKEVEYRADGSWVCQYFQENPDPAKVEREATNRGLLKCMRDGVPVGFLIKRKPKPGVVYEVLGLGFIVDWSNGYFTIEGTAHDGTVHRSADATRARASRGSVVSAEEDFVPGNDADMREKVIATVAVRRGQAAFRVALLEAYDCRCCVTGCDLKDALEAAHITPYLGVHTNHVQNGLLLRADIHTLFDLGLLAVDGNRRLVLAPALLSSQAYGALQGRELRSPHNPRLAPDPAALEKHRQWAGL
jgi:hypothetical protein